MTAYVWAISPYEESALRDHGGGRGGGGRAEAEIIYRLSLAEGTNHSEARDMSKYK